MLSFSCMCLLAICLSSFFVCLFFCLSSLEKYLYKFNFEICFHFKDKEELRVSCPVTAEDEQTDCTSAQQLNMSTSPPCTAELSALRYNFKVYDLSH